MSRWFLVPALLIGLVIGGAIAAVAVHHDGDDRGPRVVQVTAPADTSSGGTQVIEVRDGWRGHGGFFPGFFLFPLLWIALILLAVAFLWRRGGDGNGPWGGRFEEWHRQQHSGDAGPTPPAARA